MLSDIFSYSFTMLLPNWLLISIRIYSGIARFPCDSMAFLLTVTVSRDIIEPATDLIGSLKSLFLRPIMRNSVSEELRVRVSICLFLLCMQLKKNIFLQTELIYK